MNFSVIKRTLGWLLIFESVFLLLPLFTAAVYWESEFFDFLITVGICACFGGLLLIGKPKNSTIYAKEGFVIVALSWIVMSIFGALPLRFSGAYPTYIDALFETVSGFTTTGASVLLGDAVAALPRSILLWRSFMHWIGGMGVLVFIMAFLPLSGSRNLHLMQAESTGAAVNKIVPKVRQSALILYTIYTAMTALQFILLVCGKMPVFDALNAAFATAGTGGFSIKSDGFAGYSSYLQIVTTVFMLLYSVNFASYYFLCRGKWKDALNAEVKTFFVIVVSAITLISLNLCLTGVNSSAGTPYGVGEAIKHAAFTVASIVSTTGFATEDFASLWPTFSCVILVALMFVGACAGSTGGGMKVSRHMVLYKGAAHEVKRIINPRLVKRITLDGRVVEKETVRSINAYLVSFVFLFALSFFIVSIESGDFSTGFTAVTATMNNIGPGLGKVGPSGSFGFYSWWSKLVFIFDMLAGRLEIFPMLVLFAPATWRR